MPLSVIAFALGLAVSQPHALPQTPQSSASPGCEVDMQAMLALGIHAFDQDHQGGWRPLAERPECRDEAADLIRAYRQFVVERTRILYWHEGQLRAEIGETDAAIALFDQSRRTGSDDYGWNHYVDASIAFLRRDLTALEAARARLSTSRIPDWAASRPNPRPMNLDVVDALIRCFGSSYADAYGAERCRTADGR